MLRADLALYDRYRQLVALVEAKSRPGTSREWAAKFWHTILSHGDLGPIRYFLRPYFAVADPKEGLLPGPAFELAVGSWLADLMHSRERSPGGAESRSPLVESGLVDAIEGGRVEYDLAA